MCTYLYVTNVCKFVQNSSADNHIKLTKTLGSVYSIPELYIFLVLNCLYSRYKVLPQTFDARLIKLNKILFSTIRYGIAKRVQMFSIEGQLHVLYRILSGYFSKK